MRSFAMTLLVFALSALPIAGALPEPKLDHGMLVLIRPGDPGGGDMVADYVFDNETPLAVTKGGTHKAVDVTPGEHRIWCQGGGDVIDVVPGQRYYIVCGFFHGFSLIDSDQGEALVAKTKDGPPLTPDRIEGAKKRLTRMWPPMKKSFDELRAQFPVLPALEPPADAAGRTTVPRYSPVILELMENVSPANSTTGESVRFRVIEGADQKWAVPGTAVDGIVLFAGASGRKAKSGVLRIDVPAVSASDGTAVPVMGQLIAIGKSRAGAANIGFVLGGILGAAMVKGRDVVNLAGERFEFWTRDEAWIAPVAASPAPVTRNADITAKFATPIEIAALGRQKLPPVQIIVPAEGDVSSVDLLGVGDWTLAVPPKATAVRRGEGGWIVHFDGWPLLRHLRVSDPPAPAMFRVTLADGRELVAEATPSWVKTQ